TITQEDNYSKKALGYLPELEIDGLENPVVSVIHEDSGETEYTLRVNRSHFRPKVFRNGTYRVQVESSDAGVTKTLAGLSIDTVGTNSIRVV
ncbi:MAG: twin-arginine translocation pathway signal protein, partial [Lunatimonas sp.]|nr:twin-arginine translocation pathway signal protein [Lunatimonas sp.]